MGYKTLSGMLLNSKTPNHTKQTTFRHSIDDLNLDDTLEDTTNCSRSCEETSFFEVLDEIDNSIANVPDKFVVGSDKRVQIVASRQKASKSSTNKARIDVSTPAAKRHYFDENVEASTSHGNSNSIEECTTNRHPPAIHGSSSTTNGNNSNIYSEPNRTKLRVATNPQATADSESFYVTPFEPNQSEVDVKNHVMDISNLHASS